MNLAKKQGKSSYSYSSSLQWRRCGKVLFWGLYSLAQAALFCLYSHNSLVWQSQDTASDNYEKGAASDIHYESDQEQKQQQQLKRRTLARKKGRKQPDGTFNGYPIYKLNRHTITNDDDKSSTNTNTNTNTTTGLFSQFHCIGETWKAPTLHKRSDTWHEESWKHRSCRFQVLCFDTEIEEYALYLDPKRHVESHTDHHYHHHDNKNDNGKGEHKNKKEVPHPSARIQSILDKQLRAQQQQQQQQQQQARTTDWKHPSHIDDTATVYRNHTTIIDATGDVVIGDAKQYGVSIGSINGKWGLVDSNRLKWFPEVRWGPIVTDDTRDVYTLPSSVVMIPFHSLSASNPGHLVWDDFLPMYTLLEIFGFYDGAKHAHAADSNNNNNRHWIHDRGESHDLLPMRYILPADPKNGDKRGLWAGCDWLDSRSEACHKMLQKFGILLGTRRSFLRDNKDSTNTTGTSAAKLPRIPITTNRAFELKLNEDNGKGIDHDDEDKKKPLICARNAMAGFGAISDHGDGSRSHGWHQADYLVNHNQGRGGQLWDFRNFLIENLFAGAPRIPHSYKTVTRTPLSEDEEKEEIAAAAPKTSSRNAFAPQPNSMFSGIEREETYPPTTIHDWAPGEPLVVLFSAYSSETRGTSFLREAQSLRDTIQKRGGPIEALFGEDDAHGRKKVDIVVETHKFSEYTVEKQIQMASRCALFVTFCGGGSITASFLPRGGAVHIYYNERGGIEYNRPTKLPARLDWDFFNNMAYLKVNWVPTGSPLRTESDTDADSDLILAELRRIYIEREEYYKQQQQ